MSTNFNDKLYVEIARIEQIADQMLLLAEAFDLVGSASLADRLGKWRDGLNNSALNIRLARSQELDEYFQASHRQAEKILAGLAKVSNG